MRSVRDAQTDIINALTRLPADRCMLNAARGRVLASTIRASTPLPTFTHSAMDGYAVRATATPTTLLCTGTIAAGASPTQLTPLAPGTTQKIMTGAPLPSGADAVVIWEDCRVDGDLVYAPAATLGQHVRTQGEDVALGAVVLNEGQLLAGGDIAMLAALGHGDALVVRAPRVTVVPTGDELVAVGTTPADGQLVTCSTPMLTALVAASGGVPRSTAPVRDQLDELWPTLQQAAAVSDVVVTTGGVSSGDFDLVRQAIARAGGTVAFWKIAMRPGKPFCMGRIGDAWWFGLPGNPVSSWVAFELFVRPALRVLGGLPPWRRTRQLAMPKAVAAAERAQYLRARVHDEVLTLSPRQGSGDLSSLVGINALVEIPAGEGRDEGEPVTVLCLDG